MVNNLKDFWIKSTLLGLGLGQLLSLLVTFTGFTSSQLAKKGINAPSSLCFLNYVLLALVYGGIILYRRQPLKAKLYYYIMLALLDVLAKFFVIEGYQYTSLTSVMLLDCWTIPCVFLLAWLFLKAKYGLKKLVGVAICVAGLVTVVFSDVHSADGSNGINPIKGDLLLILRATLYGVSNVSESFFFRKADRVELLALLGISGVILTAPQIFIYERNEVKSILSSPGAIFPSIGFSLAMFLFYSGVPLLVKISGSSRLNLSLLTSNMWAVLIRIFVYHEKVDLIYFVGFVVVTLGLFVYSGRDEMDQSNGATATIDDKALLAHLDKAGISKKDGSRISFQGARNSLCYILGVNENHGGDVMGCEGCMMVY